MRPTFGGCMSVGGFLCALNVYIGYMLPTFGEQMSVDFVHFPRAQLSGAQLSAPKKWTVGPRGSTIRGPTERPEKVDCWATENLQLTYIPQMLAAYI